MMMQRSTGLFCLLALIVSVVLFKVKYKVVEIEQELAQTLGQIQKEEENIHILTAEWSHLNEPSRLKKLAEKYLDIVPMKTDQVLAAADPFLVRQERGHGIPCSYQVTRKNEE